MKIKIKPKHLLAMLVLTGLFAGCRKEESQPDLLSGYVIEKGTGNPVPNALVYLVADSNQPGTTLTLLRKVYADERGFFQMEFTRHPTILQHYLWTKSATHFTGGNGFENMENYVHKGTRHILLPVYKKGKMAVRIKRAPGGYPYDMIEVWTTRSPRHWVLGSVSDTTLLLDANHHVENKITYEMTSNIDTIKKTVMFMVPEQFTDTLQLVY